MQIQVLSEKPRTVHLYDWSQKEEKTRHALWCVAYRILAKGETKRAALLAVSEKLGYPLKKLQTHYLKAIRITIHETEDHD